MPKLIRASVARSLPPLIDSLGARPDPLLLRAGIPLDFRDHDSLVVTNAQMATFLDLAAHATGEPFFGAVAGKGILPDNGPVGAALTGGPTLLAALARAIVAGTRIHQGARFRIAIRRDSADIIGGVEGGRPDCNHHIVEAAFAMVIQAIRTSFGRCWTPRLVRLNARGRHGRQLADPVFSAPVQLCSDGEPALVIDRRDLARAIDPGPIGTAGGPDDDAPWPAFNLTEIVRTTISGMVEMQDLGIAEAARTLGIAPRTLQDHLAREGIAFSDLVTEVRMREAMRLLKRPDPGITGIAGLLGYSDSANFTRAFRRWTGVSPSTFRLANAPERETAALA